MNKEKGLMIGEISSLFDISIDTLRYYDKAGLLKPSRRDRNGYRYYSIGDVQRLMTIIFLRKIDVPVKEIGESLDDYNLENACDNLKEQKSIISNKIVQLQKLENILDNQIDFIEDISQASDNVNRIKKEECRSVYYIKKNLNHNDEIDDIAVLKDFISRKSHLREMPEDWFLTGRFGSIYTDFMKGDFHFCFFYSGWDKTADSILREGNYKSLIHRGVDNSRIKEKVAEQFLNKEKDCTIFEIWQIGEFYSRREKEFITEFQIFSD